MEFAEDIANITSEGGWQSSAQDAAAGIEPVVGKLPGGTDMLLVLLKWTVHSCGYQSCP